MDVEHSGLIIISILCDPRNLLSAGSLKNDKVWKIYLNDSRSFICYHCGTVDGDRQTSYVVGRRVPRRTSPACVPEGSQGSVLGSHKVCTNWLSLCMLCTQTGYEH